MYMSELTNRRTLALNENYIDTAARPDTGIAPRCSAIDSLTYHKYSPVFNVQRSTTGYPYHDDLGAEGAVRSCDPEISMSSGVYRALSLASIHHCVPIWLKCLGDNRTLLAILKDLPPCATYLLI